MKVLLLLTLLITLPAWGNTTAKQFFFSGQDYERQRLDHKVVQTVYEEQWVNSTCYEQQPYYVEECGYKDVVEKHCTTTPATKECKVINGQLKCKMVPGKEVCRDVVTKKYVCENVKKYKTVAYACTKKELVPVEKVGKRYITNLYFDFHATDLYPRLIVKSEMNPEDGTVAVTATNVDGSSVLLVAEKSEKIGGNDNITVRDINYLVKSFDRDQVLSPVSQKPSDIGLYGTWIMFKVGKVYTPQYTKFRVRIADADTGEVLINRFLQEGEYRIRTYSYDEVSRVTVELRKLGVSLSSWKDYKVKVTTKVDFGDDVTVLNSEEEIGKLTAAKTVVVD